MERTLILVAGGRGSRFGSELPKQYIELNGVPIFVRSIQVFKGVYASLNFILVVPKSFAEKASFLLNEYSIQDVQIVLGGDSRYESVKNGLDVASKSGIIGVHDAVRPLVDPAVIQNCFETAADKGSAIPVLPLENSLRKIDGEFSESVDRSEFKIVQTPQCFKAEWLHAAYGQQKKASFTDDASVVENASYPIFLVEGNKENLKITTPTDLLIANAYLNNTNTN